MTNEQIKEARERANMADSVKLPIEMLNSILDGLEYLNKVREEKTSAREKYFHALNWAKITYYRVIEFLELYKKKGWNFVAQDLDGDVYLFKTEPRMDEFDYIFVTDDEEHIEVDHNLVYSYLQYYTEEETDMWGKKTQEMWAATARPYTIDEILEELKMLVKEC